MQKIITIALNTFRESTRDKVFYSLLVFAMLMLSFSLVLGSLTVGDEIKIIKDFGLASISIFGVLIAIFVGISLVYKEVEKRTIYVILANPIARYQFILGKYAGLSLTLFVEVIVMSAALLLLCYIQNQQIPWEIFIAIIPIWLELQLILAVAIFFSSFSSPFLSGLFTLAVFVIGHLTLDLKQLVLNMDNPGLKKIADALYYIFPNLESLNFKPQVVHGLTISWQQFAMSMIYGTLYTIALLAFAIFIFNKRDIK